MTDRAEECRIYTIGHSDRSFEQFAALLKAHGVTQLIDVRSVPGSRHNPQFNKETLAKRLRSSGIGYRHMKRLGGLRRTKVDSPNLGWKNRSFRGYADYMQTGEFKGALKTLESIACKKTAAVMCAEAVPWRCHRSLIADALVKDHYRVYDIMSMKTAKPHRLTPFLKVVKGRIVYPALKTGRPDGNRHIKSGNGYG